MIRVVVTLLPVAPDTGKVGDSVKPAGQLADPVVGIEIGGIGLLNVFDMPVEDVAGFNSLDRKSVV